MSPDINQELLSAKLYQSANHVMSPFSERYLDDSTRVSLDGDTEAVLQYPVMPKFFRDGLTVKEKTYFIMVRTAGEFVAAQTIFHGEPHLEDPDDVMAMIKKWLPIAAPSHGGLMMEDTEALAHIAQIYDLCTFEFRDEFAQPQQ